MTAKKHELRIGVTLPGRKRKSILYDNGNEIRIVGYLTEEGEEILRDSHIVGQGENLVITVPDPEMIPLDPVVKEPDKKAGKKAGKK